MKEQFIDKSFRADSLTIIDNANGIISDYQDQGYSLTLRQLYYQFVSRDLIPNNQKSYSRLGNIITDARMAGLIDWEAIEDRTRGVKAWLIQESVQRSLWGFEYNIAYDFWDRLNTYVEVWVEKEALADVIKKACIQYSVPYLSCKGYLSASEAYRSGKRFEEAIQDGKHCVLIHLGDHDPSGLDMTRDNNDRIDLFSWNKSKVEVRRIALNMNQIEKYSPPPNPAKISDSRAKEYINRFGTESWELDALEPSLLKKLIQEEITSLIDFDIWEETEQQQKDARKTLVAVRENWAEISNFVSDKYL